MEQTRNQDEELRAYLLGACAAEEQKRIEEKLLSDSGYLNGLERVEESLTDQYVRGLIQGVEKDQFESYFLKSPQHQNDLQFARLLRRYFSTQEATGEAAGPPPFPSRWRSIVELSLVCIATVLIGISAFLLREVTNLRGQTQRLQAERGRAEQALAGQIQDQQRQMKELTQELADLQSRAPLNNADTVMMSLTPGMERSGGDARSLTIPPVAHWLQLTLKFQSGHYQSYQVRLQTAEGREVWGRDDLTSHGKTVQVTIPTALVPRSDYLIILNGKTHSRTTEEVATYYLNVIR